METALKKGDKMENNFVRIFQIPNDFPGGFCFGGGYDVPFKMVDWFDATPPPEMGENTDTETVKQMIRDFIPGKNYFDRGHRYLVLPDNGDAFLVNP
jgi:hypothetical protein